MMGSMMGSVADGFAYIVKSAGKSWDEAGQGATIGGELRKGMKSISLDTQTRFDQPRGQRRLSAEFMTVDPESFWGKNIDAIGTVWNTPLSYMQSKDDIAKFVLYRAEVKARSYRRAVSEGLDGDALTSRMNELIRLGEVTGKEGADQLSKSETHMLAEAFASDQGTAMVAGSIGKKSIKAAQEGTFTDALGPTAKKAQELLKMIPGNSVIVPFFKTPTKLLANRFLLERTPLGLAGGTLQTMLKKGGAEADQALAQLAMGTGLLTVGYSWAQAGVITGDGPIDTAENAAWLRAGNRPRSIRVANEWVEIGRLDPIASFLLFPANMVEMARSQNDDLGGKLEKDIMDAAILNVTAMARMTASKSWLASIGKLVDAVQSQEPKKVRRMVNFITASMLIPNVATFFANEINPDLQKADTLTGELMKRTGMGKHTRRDIFGETVRRDPQMMGTIFPLSHHKIGKEKLQQDMMAAGSYIQMPLRKIKGVELTLDQHQRMMDMMKEQDVKGAIRDVMATPMFKGLKDTEITGTPGAQSLTKKGIISMIYNAHLEQARTRLITEDAELADKIEQRNFAKANIKAEKNNSKAAREAKGFFETETQKSTVPTLNFQE